jgi:F420-dependent oxidoreductase-like protein
MPKDIWFGVHAPPEGRNFADVKRICLAAEEAGFDLFTMTDHMMNMRNPNGAGNHPLECWTTLGGLAAVTSRIMLGPLVSCYGFRRPTVLAKIATTVDIISGGRLIFGIGAGWHEDEFKGFMGEFPSSKERLEGLSETVEICKSMFSKDRTTYHGKMYDVNNVLNSPQPVQKPIPIMVGGSGEKVTLKIAAKHADISHLFAANVDELEHKLSVLRKHCETVGREYSTLRKATAMNMESGQTPNTTEKMVETIEEYKKRGISLITFRFSNLEDLQRFSKDIITRF